MGIGIALCGADCGCRMRSSGWLSSGSAELGGENADWMLLRIAILDLGITILGICCKRAFKLLWRS